MALLGIIGIVIAIVLGVVVAGIIVGGLWFIATFADIILCVVFIALVIRIIFKRKKKK